MTEQYRGYEVKVFWSKIEKAYIFCISSLDGVGIMESGAYFYEENALLGAKEAIDWMLQKKRDEYV